MILVFKTTLNEDLENTTREILSEFKEIDKIDFDFEDCDKILRIVTKHNIVSKIESLLIEKGIFCKEL
jgi:hypothetical protein